MARRDEGGYPQRSPTEEQRSQPALSFTTLRAAGLLAVARVGSAVIPLSGTGMLRPRRLGHSQNSSPQDPTQFSDRL